MHDLEQIIKKGIKSGADEYKSAVFAFNNGNYEAALQRTSSSLSNYDSAFNGLANKNYNFKYLRAQKQKAYLLKASILKKLGRNEEARDYQNLANEVPFTNGEMIKEVYRLMNERHYSSAVDICRIMYKQTGCRDYLPPLAKSYENLGQIKNAIKVRAILRQENEVRI